MKNYFCLPSSQLFIKLIFFNEIKFCTPENPGLGAVPPTVVAGAGGLGLSGADFVVWGGLGGCGGGGLWLKM